jgi:hypothetical protein
LCFKKYLLRTQYKNANGHFGNGAARRRERIPFFGGCANHLKVSIKNA